MKNLTCLIALTFFFCSSKMMGQTDLDGLAQKHAQASLAEFKSLLAIPCDAHFPKDIEKNVQWAEQAFASRGFSTQRLETTIEIPLLLAERKCSNPNAKTVLAYLQLDGQPVDFNHWHQKNPWEAVLKEEREGEGWTEIPWEKLEGELNRDWRIFARATSDAKGPVAMFLAAMDALREIQKEPNFHLKVIMDFEEELGSPHLPTAVKEHRTALKADALVIFDGPRHVSNQPTLAFGARGIADLTITVFGPTFPQHSGHYGNYCPNPAMRLSQLLAGMKDAEGRVTIPGFYDGISLDEKTKAILAQVPDDEQYIQARLGVGGIDQVAGTLQEALQYPSLNVRGLQSAWVGDEVRTIIPATATTEIDMRLVLESNPERLIGLVRKYLEDQGYLVLDRKPTSRERVQHDRICRFESSVSYLAYRTEMDSEAGQWLERAMTKAFDQSPVMIRTMGGSIPISPFVNTLNIPAISVPTVNPDNNQHSPNENIRLGNYIDGVKTILAIMMEPYGKE